MAGEEEYRLIHIYAPLDNRPSIVGIGIQLIPFFGVFVRVGVRHNCPANPEGQAWESGEPVSGAGQGSGTR